MNEKLNIQNIRVILPVLGLALLLLFSPCKVRNFVQAEFGIPQTEVANKNKTTINNLGCNIFEISEAVSANAETTLQISPAFPEKNAVFAFHDLGFPSKSDNLHQTRNQSISVVPLYILHQNFKAYL